MKYNEEILDKSAENLYNTIKPELNIEPKEMIIVSTPKQNNFFWERVFENHGFTKEQIEEFYNK